MTEEEQRTQAWIGDAVLALFARQWILARTDITATERPRIFVEMTSNHFLASLGEPTAMEAEIGRVYSNDGLEAAFNFIEKKFIPVFLRQRKNRIKIGSYRTRR